MAVPSNIVLFLWSVLHMSKHLSNLLFCMQSDVFEKTIKIKCHSDTILAVTASLYYGTTEPE